VHTACQQLTDELWYPDTC